MHYREGVEAAPGYKLISLLGRGGFGEVWKAEGPGKVTRAVKIIDKVDEKAGRKEFRALNLIKNIIHPNLVTISGFWLRDADGNLVDPDSLDDGASADDRPSQLIVAMDLGEMTLLDRLEECRKGMDDATPCGIPVEELLEYTEASAKAIDYLNIQHDVQHRDIKPQNILIVGGSAKICDFGLASTVSAIRTSMGGAGSLAYMAPEVYTSKLPSRATDQYSLAIGYVELRTGRLPLSDIESYAVLDDAKRSGTLDLSWLDEKERPIITKATAVNPADRYERCIDMVRELRSACGGGPASSTVTSVMEPIGDYDIRAQVYRRGGERIYDATGPEGHRVLLVVRELSKAPDTTNFPTLNLMRDVSRRHDHLAEMYECERLNAEEQVLPSRLFDLPNPPAPAKTMVIGHFAKENLSQRMAEGGIAPQTLLSFMEQLAGAVDFLNEPSHIPPGQAGKQEKVSILHGHLRPVNFLVEDDQILVSNFAAARTLSGDECEFPEGKRLHDGPYVPPEVATGRLTRWTDQYQLAVAFLQMRSGKPSSGLTGVTRGSRQTGEHHLLDLSSLRDEERSVIERATHVTPSQRYDSCLEMVAALQAAWEKILPTLPPDIPPEAPSEPQSEAPPKQTPAAPAALVETPSQGMNDPTLADPHSTGAISLVDTDKTQLFEQADLGGTMMPPEMTPPAMADTRLSSDTDRAELEEPATGKPKSSPQAAKLTTSKPEPDVRPIWQRPAVVGSLAAVLVVAVAGYFLRSTNDPTPVIPPVPAIGQPKIANKSSNSTEAPKTPPETKSVPASKPSLPKRVDALLAERKYSEAMAAIDTAPPGTKQTLLDALRRRVRTAWHTASIKPLLATRQFIPALKALKNGPKNLIETDPLQAWTDELYDLWHRHAIGLQKDSEHAAAIGQWNQLFSHKGESHGDADRRRLQSLDALLPAARGHLDGDHQTARDQFADLLSALEASGKTPLPLPPDVATRLTRQATLGRARANARLKAWDSVKIDLIDPQLKYSIEKDRAHLEILRLKSDALDPPISLRDKITRAEKINPNAMDPWEKTKRGEWIEQWKKRVGDEYYQRLIKRLAQAEKQILIEKQFDTARTTLEGIKKDPKLAALLKGRPLRDYEELMSLALLGSDKSDNDDIADAEQYANTWMVEHPPNAQRVVHLSEALHGRAVSRNPAGGKRTHDGLLPRVLRIITKAKPQADTKSEKQLAAIIDDLKNEFLIDLRGLRDRATVKNGGFTRLQSECKTFEELTKPHPFSTACRIESLIESAMPDGATQLLPKLRLPEKGDKDRPYAIYVAEMARTQSDPSQASFQLASDALKIIYTSKRSGDRPTSEGSEDWRMTSDRLVRTTNILYRAGVGLATDGIQDRDLATDRYPSGAAARAFGYLSLAEQLLLATDQSKKSSFSAKDRNSLQVHQALSAAYGGAPAEMGIKLTDDLVGAWIAQLNATAGPAKENIRKMSPHVMLMNFRLHQAAWNKTEKKKRDHWESAMLASEALLRIRLNKSLVYGLVFEHIIKPGYVLSSDVLSDQGKLPEPAAKRLSAPARQAAARVCAARGLYIQQYPTIEKMFINQEPEQKVYDSFNRAITLDDQPAEYFLGRAIAAHDLPYSTSGEKAEALEKDADAIEQRARGDQKQIAIATGLRGMALTQKVKLETDFDLKMDSLKRADTALTKALKNAEHSEEQNQRFLLTQGGIYLHQANFCGKRESYREYLDHALQRAQTIANNFSTRKHPERAYQLWGNTLEDYSYLSTDKKGYVTSTKGYSDAILMFTKQLAISAKDDLKGQSRALMNRGRARYRLASAVRRFPKDERDRANSNLKRAIARGLPDVKALQTVFDKNQKIYKKAEDESKQHLNNAVTDLKKLVGEKAKWKGIKAEANLWLGKIYQPNLIGNPEEADLHFEQAATIAKERDPLWAYYQLQWAGNALAFARHYADPADYDKDQVKKYVEDTEAIAEDLLSGKMKALEDRIAPRYRTSAALIVAQGYLLANDVRRAETAYTRLATSGLIPQSKLFDLHFGMATRVLARPGAGSTRRLLNPLELDLADKGFSRASPLWSNTTPYQQVKFFIATTKFAVELYNSLDKAQKESNKQAELKAVLALIKRFEDRKTMQANTKWVRYIKTRPVWKDYVDGFPKTEKALAFYKNELARIQGTK